MDVRTYKPYKVVGEWIKWRVDDVKWQNIYTEVLKFKKESSPEETFKGNVRKTEGKINEETLLVLFLDTSKNSLNNHS